MDVDGDTFMEDIEAVMVDWLNHESLLNVFKEQIFATSALQALRKHDLLRFRFARRRLGVLCLITLFLRHVVSVWTRSCWKKP